MGEEEAADFGPLVLDSDSDDSVDWDIEEAIQEYLKTKSGATQPGSGGVQPGADQQPSRASGGGSRCGIQPGPGLRLPGQLSSDDSFEQSIRVEIEQFLNKKRQHETQKCDGSVDKQPLLKSHQEPAAKVVHRQGLMGTQKELTFRRPPRSNTESKWDEEERQHRKEGRAPEAYDSSSDHSIEEAIQLYQLQKTRKEADGDPSQKAHLREERQPDPPAHSTSMAAKTTDPGPGGLDIDHFPKLPKETKAPPPFVEPSLCRADKSTELIEGSLSASPLLHSANVPSRSDGNSNSVDSYDSIEQEIQTFLALKAQSGSLLARGESCPQAAQGPLSQPGPNDQTRGPKAPL
ncbi:hypothetical protein P7K49_007595 [Saguinus oedipus]|uniref:Protein phosphatase 1 regulatory subunit 26 N-terminal domain-containing protein n=1 Tax=Saguinus oedipus TaxID=9490 RepID=A0ABQ9VVB2_SAGOE|nr:hypothetical protein P7K49_007595 [Saguinus oedipus]